jgi:hypothetical protein
MPGQVHCGGQLPNGLPQGQCILVGPTEPDCTCNSCSGLADYYTCAKGPNNDICGQCSLPPHGTYPNCYA